MVLLALLSVASPLLADDESDAPHKGNPPPHASDTMRAFQNDHHAAENLTSLALTVCDLGSAGGYPCDNIDLLAFLPLADIGGGNGVRENPEQCDGTDFGGAVCGDYNCTGGALSCAATCLIDVSSCTECSVCDGDGICETGEDCVACPSDCAQGMSAGAVCGNDVCETVDGEDCLSCPADCNGKQSKGNPQTFYCCGSGSVAGAANAVTCDDSRCTANGTTCTDQLAAPADYCCGDLLCSGEETSATCGLDCGDGSGSCELAPVGETCIVDGDCCTNKCRGRSGAKTCK